jgi:hypothetical protein
MQNFQSRPHTRRYIDVFDLDHSPANPNADSGLIAGRTFSGSAEADAEHSLVRPGE